MKGGLMVSFLACYIFAMSLCFPANPSSQSWPCQRDRHVRPLLSEALIKTRILEGQISVLHSNMSRRWPPNPFNRTNIGFFGPQRSVNKTTFNPPQILKANIRVLEAFISLMSNSTSQLRSFQVVEELVISKLLHLKRRTKTLISSHLKRLVRIITISRRGKRNAVAQDDQQKNNTNNKQASQSVQTKLFNTTGTGSIPTIEDVALRIQLILVDFRLNALTLANDLLKIRSLKCY